MATIINQELENSIILNALRDNLKTKLYKHFEEQAKPVIKEMVEACMKDLELGIRQYKHFDKFQDTIEIILREVK